VINIQGIRISFMYRIVNSISVNHDNLVYLVQNISV
jgi:hypothetical protein